VLILKQLYQQVFDGKFLFEKFYMLACLNLVKFASDKAGYIYIYIYSIAK
jgi:hypothetical protein